jgi:hypothetical protein
VRTLHLVDLKTPTLIVRGTRDAFGTREEVSAYTLSPAIEMLWLEDGDHDLKPRKSMSGFSLQTTSKPWRKRFGLGRSDRWLRPDDEDCHLQGERINDACRCSCAGLWRRGRDHRSR